MFGKKICCNYSLHNDHSLARSRIHVDVVHADTGSSDELQIRSVDYVGGHLCAGPNEQRIIVLVNREREERVRIDLILDRVIVLKEAHLNLADQLVRLEAGVHLHIDVCLAQDFNGAVVQRVTDENVLNFERHSGEMILLCG